jgi:hypothetical protein
MNNAMSNCEEAYLEPPDPKPECWCGAKANGSGFCEWHDPNAPDRSEE